MRSSRSPLLSKHLRTQVCLTYFLSQLDSDIHQFDVLISHGVTNVSGLPGRWKKNEVAMTKGKLENILASEGICDVDKVKIKGVDKIFDFPLFALLDRRTLKEDQIIELVEPWIGGSQLSRHSYWTFPADLILNQGVFDEKSLVPGKGSQSIAEVFKRGDVYALTAAVALLRLYNVQNRTGGYAYVYDMAYEICISVLKIPIFKPHADLLYKLIDDIVNANPILYRVDRMAISMGLNKHPY